VAGNHKPETRNLRFLTMKNTKKMKWSACGGEEMEE